MYRVALSKSQKVAQPPFDGSAAGQVRGGASTHQASAEVCVVVCVPILFCLVRTIMSLPHTLARLRADLKKSSQDSIARQDASHKRDINHNTLTFCETVTLDNPVWKVLSRSDACLCSTLWQMFGFPFFLHVSVICSSWHCAQVTLFTFTRITPDAVPVVLTMHASDLFLSAHAGESLWWAILAPCAAALGRKHG
eukprot:scaffold263208_cov18-Tisochrysis_lutea.AAC.1